MSKFSGFTMEDFEIASTRSAHPAALARLVAASRARLGKSLWDGLGELRLEVAGDRSPDGQENSAADAAIVQLSIGETGLGLSLDVMGKSSDAFLTWLNDGTALRALDGLSPFELVVLERRPENFGDRYGAKRPKWSGTGTRVERLRYPAAEIDDETREEIFSVCRSFDDRWEKVGISMRRDWTREHCVTRGQKLVTELTDRLAQLSPIVGSINYLVRRAKTFKAPALERASWRAS